MSYASAQQVPVAVRLGHLWFRWRSLSPVPFFLLMVVLPPNFQPSLLSTTLATVWILLAELVRIWGVGTVGSATRTRTDQVFEFVHSGPYRFTRNPLYLANIALYTLGGVMFGFLWLSFAVFIFTCVEYHFIVRFEEATMSKVFGQSYENYRKAVPRWGVTFSPYVSSAHAFSVTRALRSERSTFLSIAAMIVLFSLKRGLLLKGN